MEIFRNASNAIKIDSSSINVVIWMVIGATKPKKMVMENKQNQGACH